MSFVSILIPCYNAERWIRQAIDSSLAQTWTEKEVIVMDDGSSDSSLEVIKGFGDRIRWQSGPNRGGNVARNQLLEMARGEWLQYLDADDYLLPFKVASQMETVARHSDADVIYSPVTIEHWSDRASTLELFPIPEPHDPWILLARWYLPQTGGSLWRRQAIVDVGAWREDQPCCQEHELYSRLLISSKQFRYCESGGAVYRQWGEHTVCKRDKLEVRRRRLDIEQRAEDFLKEARMLTPARRQAINEARFEIARLAWQDDPGQALRIVRTIRESQPSFVPKGPAAPRLYRYLLRTCGFRVAESIADVRRNFLQTGR